MYMLFYIVSIIYRNNYFKHVLYVIYLFSTNDNSCFTFCDISQGIYIIMYYMLFYIVSIIYRNNYFKPKNGNKIM